MTQAQRVTVVIGGAIELGLACTLRAAVPGGHVIIVDEDAALVDAAVAAVHERGATAMGIALDLADLDGLAALPTRLPEHIRYVDTLVNCQFATDKSTVSTVDVAVWERVVRVNLTGPMVLAQALQHLLGAAEHPSIVNVGTIDGLQGNPWLPAYSSSKGGLVALTHIMASDYGSRGIRANYVARCGTKEMKALLEQGSGDPLRADWEESLAAVTPLGRIGSADETAAVVEFLASPAASFVNGAVLTVDGGRTGITAGTV